MKLNQEDKMKQAAHAVVTQVACLRRGLKTLIICGKHNLGFAEFLVKQCYDEDAFPHLWMWDENLLSATSKMAARKFEAKVPKHTLSLLTGSDLVIWLTQYENPVKAEKDLGPAVCSFWDRVYEVVKNRPLLTVNLFSAKSMESMHIEYGEYLAAFFEAVNVNYRKMRKIGTKILTSLEGRRLINVTDPNGTDLTFSIEDRRIGFEAGTLEDCYSTGKECEVEVPAGEVYVAPVETSAFGRLVADEVRDFRVRRLQMNFEDGQIVDFNAEKGEAAFRKFLDEAHGKKDTIAEFGLGINYAVKPIGLRICDEKALGTAHVAIGNNVHVGGINDASIHIDFNLYNPTVRVDNDVVLKAGRLAE
jgi:leucyl aminopeptidase (aminopeptidase T)